MATLREVYELLKQKQKDGDDIGMFGESYLRMIEVEKSRSFSAREKIYLSSECPSPGQLAKHSFR